MCKQIVEQKSEEILEAIASEKLPRWFKWIVAIAFIVMAGIFALYFCNFSDFCAIQFNDNQSSSNADWGTFGDFIGGTLNPILSFLSLIALLFTIVLQSKELEATRTELRRSASAQESTQAILDEQSKTLARQQFEGTFFSLLDQHNKILENLTAIQSDQKRYSKFQETIDLIFWGSNVDHSYKLQKAKVYLEEKDYLCGHYFRVLYQLLKFIATNSPSSTIGQAFEADKIEHEQLSDDEKMYSSILRSFLNYEVTQLLAINCYCTDSTDTYWRYKLLIERYSFLEHMPFEIDGTENKFLVETIPFYKPSAFGNNNFVKRYHEQHKQDSL